MITTEARPKKNINNIKSKDNTKNSPPRKKTQNVEVVKVRKILKPNLIPRPTGKSQECLKCGIGEWIILRYQEITTSGYRRVFSIIL